MLISQRWRLNINIWNTIFALIAGNNKIPPHIRLRISWLFHAYEPTSGNSLWNENKCIYIILKYDIQHSKIRFITTKYEYRKLFSKQ